MGGRQSSLLLGVLRGTAVGRSVTFLVFRDPPKPDERRHHVVCQALLDDLESQLPTVGVQL